MKRPAVLVLLLTFFAAVLPASSLLGGCRRSAPAGPLPIPPVVQAAGIYTLPGGTQELHVSVKNGIVVFTLEDQGTVLISSVDVRASDYSRWAFAWDASRKRLWFVSSDIGSFLWDPRTDGTYKRIGFGGLTDAAKLTIPLALYDAMSSSSQRSLPPREKIAAAQAK